MALGSKLDIMMQECIRCVPLVQRERSRKGGGERWWDLASVHAVVLFVACELLVSKWHVGRIYVVRSCGTSPRDSHVLVVNTPGRVAGDTWEIRFAARNNND